MKMTYSKSWVFDQSLSDLEGWFTAQEAPSFAWKQFLQWCYQKGELHPSAYSNLSQKIRLSLEEAFSFQLIPPVEEQESSDGSVKFLFPLGEKALIESVCMPFENRTTLCVSSQAGCSYGCRFCQTGRLGFLRHLSSGEILLQVLWANLWLKKKGLRPVTNVVFMGMGEPLDNWDSLQKALSFLIHPQAFALTRRKVTVSTVGLVPQMKKLGEDFPGVSLAISLHFAQDEKRSRFMPINRSYSLKELKKALETYPAHPRYGITFEYLLIAGENDGEADAKALVSFVSGLKAKINLIPMNPHPGMPWKAPDEEGIRRFQEALWRHRIPAPVRYSRAQDVSGACGQLAAKRQGEVDLKPLQTQFIRDLRVENRTRQDVF